MKYLSLVILFAAMVCGGRAAKAQALSGPAGSVCGSTNNMQTYLGIPVDHDTCVLMVNTAEHQNGAEAVATCKLLQDEGVLGNATIGECVRGFKSAHNFGATQTSLGVFGALLFSWYGFGAMRRWSRRRDSLLRLENSSC